MRKLLLPVLLVLSACAYAPPTREAIQAATDSELHIELMKARLRPWYFPATLAACSKTATEIRGVLVARHPEWPEAIQSDVLAGVIKIGTTRAHLLASWGIPDRVNSTVTRRGSEEQWVYDEVSINQMKFVYLERDVVVAIQH